MERIKVNELVDFRRKDNIKFKRNFAMKLKTRVAKQKVESDDDVEPRDYWVFSTSCIYQAFKNGDDEFYDPKIDELQVKMLKPDIKSSVFLMYKRNRDILISFKEFELNNHRPKELKRHGVQTEFKTMTISDYPLYVRPTMVFTYQKNGKNEIGGLWLVPQVNGFKKSELGIFCEVLYRFLIKNYANDYQISHDYCIAIDTVNAQSITYTDLLDGTVPFLLDETLNQIKNI